MSDSMNGGEAGCRDFKRALRNELRDKAWELGRSALLVVLARRAEIEVWFIASPIRSLGTLSRSCTDLFRLDSEVGPIGMSERAEAGKRDASFHIARLEAGARLSDDQLAESGLALIEWSASLVDVATALHARYWHLKAYVLRKLGRSEEYRSHMNFGRNYYRVQGLLRSAYGSRYYYERASRERYVAQDLLASNRSLEMASALLARTEAEFDVSHTHACHHHLLFGVRRIQLLNAIDQGLVGEAQRHWGALKGLASPRGDYRIAFDRELLVSLIDRATASGFDLIKRHALDCLDAARRGGALTPEAVMQLVKATQCLRSSLEGFASGSVPANLSWSRFAYGEEISSEDGSVVLV